ncbi:MAG: hypothetical protein HY298_04525 [Verrucomicrobia bacterium]|nr:hypothetical protein [Verrucomicrobiota bacterium]
MIEIALCLAIIGFALVAIIGVLPTGMQVQKDNREETIINQDATYLIEAIRGGAHGLDDLTNYVDLIRLVTVTFPAGAPVTQTFTYTRTNGPLLLNSGERIIGLLSTPKYQYTAITNNKGDFSYSVTRSNYVTAYLRAISGSAVEKATNADARAFAFSYRVTPEIIPYTPPVVMPSNFWRYAENQQTNLYELRLLFRWPVQPNGNIGNGRQIFRTTVSSTLTSTNIGQPVTTLYFFEPRSYAHVLP